MSELASERICERVRAVRTIMRKAISRCVVCSKHHEHQPLRSNLCAEANQSNAARADATSSAHPSRSTARHGSGRNSRPLLVHSRAPLLDHFIAQRTQHVVDVGLASARVPSPRFPIIPSVGRMASAGRRAAMLQVCWRTEWTLPCLGTYCRRMAGHSRLCGCMEGHACQSTARREFDSPSESGWVRHMWL